MHQEEAEEAHAPEETLTAHKVDRGPSERAYGGNVPERGPPAGAKKGEASRLGKEREDAQHCGEQDGGHRQLARKRQGAERRRDHEIGGDLMDCTESHASMTR